MKPLSAFDGPRAHADEARRFPHLLSESLKKDKLAAGAKIDYATWVAARKLGETGRAAVDDLVTDAYDQPAADAHVDLDVQGYRPPVDPAQLLG